MSSKFYTAADVAKHVGGEVMGDGSVALSAFAPADSARAGDLTFAENENYFARAEKSAASAILVATSVSSSSKTLIRVANPRVAFAKVLPLFFPEPFFAPGVHPSAQISSQARIDPTAHIGAFCIVADGVQIGPRTVLEGGNHLGADCVVGEDSHLFPNVVLYARSQVGNRVRIHSGTVVGSDGFGYVFDQGRHLKVPQIGNVIIQDDVEIGSNVSIDRGALGSTIIGRGTKIDNLVQIGHNVVLGEHCILCGQVGVAGSTKVGSYTTMAGQVGVAGHLTIGSQVTLGAQAGVMNNIPDGEKWLGAPAQPDRDMKRIFVALQRLPELSKRVKELEKRLEEREGEGKK
ncbi:MAG TPA: UDP-3-O-(3-hydroxymyristoyl)glucosamine N-acyltransferase [Verrucomicrobiae bacterium]|nr:UDP-3-O-(3-hydroxymyristoyl)glucosamine N-acyltransferase [Verrucomicrobiae bacterium]